MKRFGIGKKGDDEDTNKSKLFGSSKSRSLNQTAANPYAVSQPDLGDHYSQPSPSNFYPNKQYAGSMTSSTTQLPLYSPGPSSQQSAGGDRYLQPVASRGGYSNQGSYGNQSGYGAPIYQDQRPTRRSGGYGGLGRTHSDETTNTDAGRDALFGGARERYQQQQQQQQASQLPPEEQYGANGHGANSFNADSGYGGYDQGHNRQLTAEEQEEEDVQATKDQIRNIKRQDASSTRNALRIAQQAEETGRGKMSAQD